MKIKQLEINGFKSFHEKARIEFPPGISAVVGPNGCGKSNIVDALRWV
ncbi:MAG: AAA family ATPase, partial [Desulfobacteraceae bacterium]|nr:AAA family ATPase [Desulfobacteraceae bacterium]